jgi:hypothetical protein
MPDFSQLLSRPADSWEKPKPLPAGTYFGTILGYSYQESSQKKTPSVRYELSVTDVGKDIDVSELVDVDLTKKKFTHDFYLTEGAGYRLVEFVEKMGVSTSGRSTGEFVPDLVGKPVMMEVSKSPREDDPDSFYNRVERLAPVPAEQT